MTRPHPDVRRPDRRYAVVAVADWWAVGTDDRRAEYVLKPLTMVVLIAATLALSDPVSDVARWAFVAALVFSLVGDVFLMLEDHFVEGLASFRSGSRLLHRRTACVRLELAAGRRRAWSW